LNIFAIVAMLRFENPKQSQFNAVFANIIHIELNAQERKYNNKYTVSQVIALTSILSKCKYNIFENNKLKTRCYCIL